MWMERGSYMTAGRFYVVARSVITAADVAALNPGRTIRHCKMADVAQERFTDLKVVFCLQVLAGM